MTFSVKQMARLAILASLCVALRLSFGALPNIKPITAIFLVLLLYLSWQEACLIMGLTMTVTGFYMGFGPWILWQIVAYGVVLLLWQLLVLPAIKTEKLNLALQSILAAIMPFIYSVIMGLFSVGTYGGNLWPYLLNGLVFDYLHAVSTLVFYPIVFYSLRRLFLHEKIMD